MLAVGLMSGTSLDGIDAALVEIEGVDAETSVELKAFETYPLPGPTRERIRAACQPGGADARLLSSLNMELGQLFSDAVGRICDKAGVDTSWLGFVASHGQTVWHEPDASRVYADGKRYHASTLQLGEPALIAYDHNVRVVANFRSMDMVAGGQGAPLVPFSEVVLYGVDDVNRALLNVGGIGNVTVLPAGRRASDVFAFDTGPGNMMVDEACRRLFDVPFDEGGRIAQAGTVDEAVLAELLAAPYFAAEPPKSTGRELFGAPAVERFLAAHPALAPADAVATLTELTAASVADACDRWAWTSSWWAAVARTTPRSSHAWRRVCRARVSARRRTSVSRPMPRRPSPSRFWATRRLPAGRPTCPRQPEPSRPSCWGLSPIRRAHRRAHDLSHRAPALRAGR